jgi:hypothetical protein
MRQQITFSIGLGSTQRSATITGTRKIRRTVSVLGRFQKDDRTRPSTTPANGRSREG